MGVTNIYLTNTIGRDIDISLLQIGPGDLVVQMLTHVGRPGQTDKIGILNRNLDDNGSADLALSVGGSYVGSLGILLAGHVFGSAMWYRHRTGNGAMGWTSDREDHSVRTVTAAGTFTLTVTANSVFLGYDDIAVNLASGG